jgi:4-hydroxybenzoate polyprenyltransferase
MAVYTSFSLLESSALVASSSISILGFLISALAIAILYFYPPDRFNTLDDPMYVSSLFSISYTNAALAFSSASLISSSVASLFPNSKLSLIVPSINAGS